MSYPTFADFDKSVSDLFTEDFKAENTFKVKAKAPNNLTFTSTSTISVGEKKSCTGKLGVKWAHPSGFSLEKLEFDAKGKFKTETSLEGAAPGLKLEFKGDDDTGDLSFTYKIPTATFAGEVDGIKFGKAKVSAYGFGFNGVNTGYSCALDLTNKTQVHKVGAKYNGINNLDLALWFQSNKDFKILSSYKVNDKISVATSVDRTSDKISQALVASYACVPVTNMKFKFGRCSAGKLSFNYSVTQTIDKNFKVTGVAAVDDLSAFSPSNVKLGVNCQLG